MCSIIRELCVNNVISPAKSSQTKTNRMYSIYPGRCVETFAACHNFKFPAASPQTQYDHSKINMPLQCLNSWQKFPGSIGSAGNISKCNFKKEWLTLGTSCNATPQQHDYSDLTEK